MRKTALILALTIAVPAWGQDKSAEKPAAEKPAAEKPAAEKPAAAQESQKAAPAAKAEPSRKTGAKKHSRRMEDARHCLDKPTNTEIIKCAEAYL
jgi:hypothetical protein